MVCNKNDFDPSEIIALYFVLVLLVSKVQVQGILYQNLFKKKRFSCMKIKLCTLCLYF